MYILVPAAVLEGLENVKKISFITKKYHFFFLYNFKLLYTRICNKILGQTFSTVFEYF